MHHSYTSDQRLKLWYITDHDHNVATTASCSTELADVWGLSNCLPNYSHHSNRNSPSTIEQVIKTVERYIICLVLIITLLNTVWWRCSWNPSVVLSHLSYCVVVWSPCLVSTLLQRLQRISIVQWGCVVICENITIYMYALYHRLSRLPLPCFIQFILLDRYV